jgi:glycerophosphoryl diester phosphodiesterase
MEVKPQTGRETEAALACLEVARDLWPAAAAPLLLSSFSVLALEVARERAPQWPRGLLLGGLTDDWRAGADAVEAWSVHAAAELMSAQGVAEVLDAGYRVMVYTVNDPGRAANLWDWGVDAIITDRPEVLLPLAGA